MKESEENEIMTEETKPAGHLVFNIDVMLAKRKMSVTKLAEAVGITCQPGDLFEYVKD